MPRLCHLIAFIITFVPAQFCFSAIIKVPSEYTTINSALAAARSGDIIEVSPGVYHEQLILGHGVVLQATNQFDAIIDAGGFGTAVTMTARSVITGFVIRNGKFGIISRSAGNVITACFIEQNRESGVLCIGGLPRIEDNIIVNNKGSGVEGWNVRSTDASINHNTIVFNRNGGISIGGMSDIMIENNIIHGNREFGIRSVQGGRIRATVNNISESSILYVNVLEKGRMFASDPKFSNPGAGDFSLQHDSKCLGTGSDQQDLGSRVVSISNAQ